jgi:hypothetical protein
MEKSNWKKTIIKILKWTVCVLGVYIIVQFGELFIFDNLLAYFGYTMPILTI